VKGVFCSEKTGISPQRRRGGRGGMRKKRRRLNTKAPRHKGQRGEDAWEKFKFESKFK